jgi:hypothetical protein
MPCPIRLENFDDATWDEMGEASPRGSNNNTVSQSGGAMKLVNSYGIPVQGNDRWPLERFSTTRFGRPG